MNPQHYDDTVSHVDHLVETLEAIANFATGPAGPAARNALVATGYWPLTSDGAEREHATDTWLAAGAPMPGHDAPAADALPAALSAGRTGLFVLPSPPTAVRPGQLPLAA